MHPICAALALAGALATNGEPAAGGEAVMSPDLSEPAQPSLQSAPPAAQSPSSADGFRWSLDGGVLLEAKPTEFESTYKPGVGVGVGVLFDTGESSAIWGRLAYARAEVDDPTSFNGGFGGTTTVEGGALQLWSLQAGVRRWLPQGAARPYVDAGIGVDSIGRDRARVVFYNPFANEWTTVTVDSSTRRYASATLGAGLAWQVSRSVALSFDVHLVAVRTSPERTFYVPIRVGLLFR